MGKWIFWGFCALAVLIVAASIAGLFLPPPPIDPADPFSGTDDAPPLFAGIIAVVVVGCGAAARLVLTGLDRLFRK